MVGQSRHPSYPNPAIMEAVCEIHFRFDPPASWQPSLFADFYRRVEARFPKFEPVPLMGVQLTIGPGSASQALLPQKQMMRYRHRERENVLLQVSDNLLSVNMLPEYPGWDSMEREITDGWADARAVIKPSAITRVVLRYINGISREAPEDKLEDWIAPSKYVPSALVKSSSNFFYRMHCQTDASTSLSVTLAEAQQDRKIILDIECSITAESPTGSEVIERARTLHDLAWDVFKSAASPRLIHRLEGAK